MPHGEPVPNPDLMAFQGQQTRQSQIHGGSLTDLPPIDNSRSEKVNLFIQSMKADTDGYFVQIGPRDPYNGEDEDFHYPSGYLSIEVTHLVWQRILVGQIVPTTLNL